MKYKQKEEDVYSNKDKLMLGTQKTEKLSRKT